jgi:hypothetical protein
MRTLSCVPCLGADKHNCEVVEPVCNLLMLSLN